MRKNTKAVIWAVVICFALWGGFSIGTQFQKRGRIAGEVFGKEISFQEYHLFYRATQIFSNNLPATDENLLRQKTWQSILYSREAKRQKIEITDEEVRLEILRLLEAHQITNPSSAVYRNWLAANLAETPQEFEKQIREMMRIQKLMKKINEQPLARTPAEEQAALVRYKSEQDTLSAEMALFPGIDEAKAFREKVKNAGDWKKAVRKLPPDRLKNLSLSAGAWTRDFKVPYPAVQHLQSLGKGSLSEPVRAASSYAVFLVLDSHTEPLAKFESVLKEQYLRESDERRKYERFFKWHLEVEKKAKIKDYLPDSQSSPEPEPQSAGPSSSSASSAASVLDSPAAPPPQSNPA